MFYFLLILGGGFILIGLQKRKKERNPDSLQFMTLGADIEDKPVDSSGLHELNDRIDQLQKLVFESLLVKEENKSAENELIFEEKVQGFKDEILKSEQMEKPVETLEHKEVILSKTKLIPDNIKAMLEYESKGLSVQEIAIRHT